jgi:hypothetical protein
MELAFAQHEVGCGDAHIGAIEHQPEMLRPDMLAARFKAVRGCHAETDGVAFQAIVDAGLHLIAVSVHGNLPCLCGRHNDVGDSFLPPAVRIQGLRLSDPTATGSIFCATAWVGFPD